MTALSVQVLSANRTRPWNQRCLTRENSNLHTRNTRVRDTLSDADEQQVVDRRAREDRYPRRCAGPPYYTYRKGCWPVPVLRPAALAGRPQGSPRDHRRGYWYARIRTTPYVNNVYLKSGTGPKAMGGYSAVDNGYARFDHVRIPREQMLSGFASVTPDGQYVHPPHAKLSYGGVSIPLCPLS